MTERSFRRRYWASLTESSGTAPVVTDGRRHRGHTFRRRYWAALLGVRLPHKDADDVRSDSSTRVALSETVTVDDDSVPAVLLDARERTRALHHAVDREPGRGGQRGIPPDLGTGLDSNEELERFMREELTLARELDRVLGLTLTHELSGDIASSPTLDVARILARALVLNLDLTLDRENDLALGRELDQAIALARSLGFELDRAAELAQARATARQSARAFNPRGLATRATAMKRTREYARAIDLTRTIARQLARELTGTIDARLMATAIDAQGADLSHITPSDMEILLGVVWNEQTLWPAELIGLVRARSREIRSAVWQVVGGTEHTTAELTSV